MPQLRYGRRPAGFSPWWKLKQLCPAAAVLLVSNVDYGSDDEDPDLAVVDGFLLKARLAGADLTVYWPQR
jgi:hypothetical protein